MTDPRPTPTQYAILEYLAAVAPSAPTLGAIGRAVGVGTGVVHRGVTALWSLGYARRLEARRTGGAAYVAGPGALERARAVGVRPAGAKPGHVPDAEVLASALAMVEDGRYPSHEAIAVLMGRGRMAVWRAKRRLLAAGRWPTREIARAGLDRFTEARASLVKLSIRGRKRRRGETIPNPGRKAV